MRVPLLPVLAALAFATVAFGQTSNSNDGFYQLGFAANLNIGDSVLDITNDGYNGGPYTAGSSGNVCANIYVFDATQSEIACCACLVPPNSLHSLSARNDLISNALTPGVPTSIVIKVLGSQPAQDPSHNYTVCDAATAGTTRATPLEYGLVVWGTTIHALPTSPVTYGLGTGPFAMGQLGGILPSVNAGGPLITTPIMSSGYLKTNGLVTIGAPPAPGSDLYDMTSTCKNAQNVGTGTGICKGCRLGGLGGAKQ